MSSEIEVLPVLCDEIVRILGSLDIEALEGLLDEIKILRKTGIVDRIGTSAFENNTKALVISEHIPSK